MEAVRRRPQRAKAAKKPQKPQEREAAPSFRRREGAGPLVAEGAGSQPPNNHNDRGEKDQETKDADGEAPAALQQLMQGLMLFLPAGIETAIPSAPPSFEDDEVEVVDHSSTTPSAPSLSPTASRNCTESLRRRGILRN
ncbi:hypothetical protein GQ600_25570 [Phytophthora cactorum]|nr:hypothetical protein GQ600_25570 [Phytophthora cactorum]